MQLKTLVKVGNITNLSDARYCAGMGVDMLGFNAVEGSKAYIAPALYQEIRGWVAGPLVVAELYNLPEKLALQPILEAYRPDYLELGPRELTRTDLPRHIPLILSLENEFPAQLSKGKQKIAYIQIKETNAKLIKSIADTYDVLIELRSADSLLNILNNEAIKGLSLSGSPEVRPGFKDYGDLADILDQLEVE